MGMFKETRWSTSYFVVVDKQTDMQPVPKLLIIYMDMHCKQP